jgi:CubicO group peptidase (beta-lactamase class C family)
MRSIYKFSSFLLMMNICYLIPLISQETEIDAIVTQALEEFRVPGAAVSVIVGNKIIHCKGYGMRDLENALPVTKNTVFPIASNTKAFTSFLIGQLVEEGKVSWDDPVIKYIPEFRMYTEELSSQVTLRDLIAHRTGIPRHDALWYLVREMSEDDVLKALPHFPPMGGFREIFMYNNLMYVVAGKVIHNVTQNTWEEEIVARILKPLGMRHSGISLKNFQEMSDVSKPYAEIGNKIQRLPFLYPHSTLAASAIHSSASDMAKWVQIQLFDEKRPHFIQASTLKEMHTIHMPFAAAQIHMDNSFQEPSGYGLGWEIDIYRGRKHVHHGGNLEGYFSEVSLLPEEKIGLVILTNNSTNGPYAISYIKNMIYDHLLGFQNTDWMDEFREKRLEKKLEVDVSSLQKYEGCYIHPAYGTMHISIEYDSLMATLGNMKVTLNKKKEGIFEAKYPALFAYGRDPNVEFSFFSNAWGEIIELHVPFEHFRSAPLIIFKRL